MNTMAKKEENKATKPRKKPGLPKGRTNNPNGRPKGSKNKIQYDIRKAIYEKVSDVKFVKSLFDDISEVDEADKRAKLKIDLVKLFVPRPLNNDEERDKDLKSALFARLAGTEPKEE